MTRLIEECGEIGNDEEDILESMAKDDLIKRMMEKLNERQRDIVYLFYFEQWRQQDIAGPFRCIPTECFRYDQTGVKNFI